jgi:uncharacterized membrane protein YedE/YeeE
MMGIIIALFSGVLFATGLVISGMTNPDKVIGFLDVFGHWDYSLAFVMVGAIGVSFISFKFLLKKKPYCSSEYFLPIKKEVDKKILFGAAFFGVGWGLSGICPGPGIVNLATGDFAAILFVASLTQIMRFL